MLGDPILDTEEPSLIWEKGINSPPRRCSHTIFWHDPDVVSRKKGRKNCGWENTSAQGQTILGI